MKFPNLNTSRLALATAGLAAVVAGSAPAVAQDNAGAPPQGWFKACQKQQEVEICNVQQILTANTGQLITAVSLVEVKGSVNRRVFQVTVPTGRLLPPGVGLQVDANRTQKLDYVICFPDRCVAEAPLNDQLVNSFKRGKEITLTSVNFQNQPNPIKVTLTGFTGAFDGPPLQQSDLEDRQKKLEEFVNKNNDDFAKRLKEEQEKAKAGSN